MNELQSIIHRYGVLVQLICNGEHTSTRGFVMPLRRRHMMYLKDSKLVEKFTASLPEYYLYLGPADFKPDEGSQMNTLTKKFDVIVSNTTSVSDIDYSYAVLQLGAA